MCGIVGLVDRAQNLDDPENALRLMNATIEHRGPDGEGVWYDNSAGIGFGHRRLAIIDLSSEGHQPMMSHGGRFVISYNGEVYNFNDLRSELQKQGESFKGTSDTEVILQSIEQWGVESAIRRFVGMFAFALYDKKERRLHLVRDRLGIKPLYYGWVNGTFVFASELKAIRALPGFNSSIDRNSVALLLRYGYIPAPFSIYSGIQKLRPGSVLSYRIFDREHTRHEVTKYWSAHDIVQQGISKPFSGDKHEALESLDEKLKEAVKLRMVSDVPLGAFLSGGVDSSLVVALMQAQSNRPIRTFSIGFHVANYNEAKHAKEVAQHLGTEHTELYVTPEEAMSVIPKLPTLYDEPFADSSQIPTFLVSQLARQHVTVSLSGDGGDELFGGYNRYFWGRDIWKKIGWAPRFCRSLLGRSLTSIAPDKWDKANNWFSSILPDRYGVTLLGDKMHKLANVIDVSGQDELYFGLVSHWQDPSSVVMDSIEPATQLYEEQNLAIAGNFTERMMYMDLVTYLPDDILTKVDRASMGVSLEARVPLLDHRVVEFAWTLPLDLKLRDGHGKWLLKQVLYEYVPRELIDRPKMGFAVPVDLWLRGPLRDWAEALLSEQKLRADGIFDVCRVRTKWAEHLSGNRNWQYQLWNVLMFQEWLNEQSSFPH